ncbi:hypothetical protein HPB48_012152 [Haemaphysalis longicornis]|uniref:Uncharacterized protein n=1 Tax=Haemaphysalis longicornis TaxID=44386 RepID=A0A9J6FDE2_HAELO|nr:hypothetical protein HPB48_012152 [Haemaphysalis longicornis]
MGLSYMIVTEGSTAKSPVSVTYQTKNSGHAQNVAHLKMTEEQRAVIADDISRVVPMSTVLKKITDSRQGAMRPIDVIKGWHLHNIKRQFILHGSERCHDYDASSVHIRVRAMANKKRQWFASISSREADMPGSTFAKDFALVFMTEAQKGLSKELGSGTVCID